MTTELITPEDAALQLHVKPETIKHWLRAGKIKGCKFGKFWRIQAADFQDFVRLHIGDDAQ